MRHKRLRAWGASLPLLLLSACGSGGLLATVGPDYQAEPLPSSTGWRAPQPSQLAHHGEQTDLLSWWERFNDPALTRLLSAADVAVAEQQYQAAASRFRDKARTAVKEVEEAMVRLNSAGLRLPQGRAAVDGYRTNYQSLEALNQNGLGSLLDVETARRILLSAELALKTLEQERVSAWIALYRAAGGGWTANAETAAQNDARFDTFSIQQVAFNGGTS